MLKQKIQLLLLVCFISHLSYIHHLSLNQYASSDDNANANKVIQDFNNSNNSNFSMDMLSSETRLREIMETALKKLVVDPPKWPQLNSTNLF